MKSLLFVLAVAALAAGCSGGKRSSGLSTQPVNTQGGQSDQRGGVGDQQGAPGLGSTVGGVVGQGGGGAAGAVRARFDRAKAESDLKQIGLAYHNVWASTNRGPANVEELAPYYENRASITQAIKDGTYVIIWGATIASMTDGTSNTVLGYSAEADTRGMRAVLFGDGAVRGVNDADFKAAPKAKGR